MQLETHALLADSNSSLGAVVGVIVVVLAVVALVALGAMVRTRGPRGERQFPVEDLYRLPGETPHLEHTLHPGELITAVEVPSGARSV